MASTVEAEGATSHSKAPDRFEEKDSGLIPWNRMK
jgi:hypothetical protein